FRLRAENVVVMNRSATLIAIIGFCPGLVLEDLELTSNQRETYIGIEGFPGSLPQTDQDAPIIIRRCTIRHAVTAIGLRGIPNVILHSNVIENPAFKGIVLYDLVQRIHVVGNRIGGARLAAIQLE